MPTLQNRLSQLFLAQRQVVYVEQKIALYPYAVVKTTPGPSLRPTYPMSEPQTRFFLKSAYASSYNLRLLR